MDRLYIGNNTTGKLAGLSLSPAASTKLAGTGETKLPDRLPNQSVILDGNEVQVVANPPWPFNPVK